MFTLSVATYSTSMAGGLERRQTEHVLPAATPQNVSSDPGGSRVSLDHPSTSHGSVGHPAASSNRTHRRVTRRPVTRSVTHSGPAIRGLSGSRRLRNVLIPLIEINTNSEEE